eukprot:353456-Chlamydomonas_euryale.AAC.2
MSWSPALGHKRPNVCRSGSWPVYFCSGGSRPLYVCRGGTMAVESLEGQVVANEACGAKVPALVLHSQAPPSKSSGVPRLSRATQACPS